ncbi:MAG: tetratricopeptide repeat protein [Pseudonocardiaceae bacterium]
MPRRAGNSAKAERDTLRERMRGYECTVGQIAAELARQFTLRPKVAWRHALGWPQWKLAQRYNTDHPGAKPSDNRISEFEAWPHGGCPPSLRYLAQLAVTFGHGCTAAQLINADDLERLTPAERRLLTTGHPPPAITTAPARPGAELMVPTDPAGWMAAMGLRLPGEFAPLLMTCLGSVTARDSEALATPHERDRAYHQLVQFLTRWAHTMKRRNALRTLGWAATAASVGHFPDPDEQARVATVLSNPGRVDARTLEHFETVLWRCKQQDDALDPRGVLDTVLAQRSLLRSLLPGSPASLQPRLLSALGLASYYAGWCSFDLNDVDSAEYFNEDARALAHDAGNIALGAIVLGGMSGLAVFQDKPRIGIDHAVAARQWADRTGDMRLRAWTAAAGLGRAYAADGQRDACLAALDTAETELGRAGEQVPSYYSINYYEGIHASFCGGCYLKLRDTERAIDYAQRSLVTLDRSYTRHVALTTVDLARAYAQSDEVDEAARLLGDAAEIAAGNSSARLVTALRQGRADLRPWADTTTVRALDDRLASCGAV